MAKRYLGGGVSFEQKDVYQEFSEDEGGGGGGSTTLAGLTDVDISNPTDGQVLVYNAASQKWVNGSAGGGGALIVHQSHDEVHGIDTLDKTWKEIADAIQLSPVLLVIEDDTLGYGVTSSPIQSVSIEDDSYWVNFKNRDFGTDSENGYPSYQSNEQ